MTPVAPEPIAPDAPAPSGEATPSRAPRGPKPAWARRVRRRVKLLVSIALLGGVVYAIGTKDGVGALGARLSGLHPAWLLVAALLQLAAVATSVARWNVLLRSQRLLVPARLLVRSFLVGRFIGVLTPSTAGLDVYRAVDIGRRTGHPAASARVILVEKAFGLLALSIATIALLPFGVTHLVGPLGLVITFGVAALAGAGLWVLRRPRALTPLARLLGPLRGRAEKLLGALASEPVGAGAAMASLGLGVLGHVLTASVFVATGMALGVSASVFELLFVGLAIVLAVLLPISVGGVGVREGTAVLLLGTIGVAPTDAALLALLGYLAGQPPALLGGLLSLSSHAAERAPDELTPAESSVA